MAKLISFYSPIQSQGKRTFSLGLAHLLAKNNYKTLFIELDLNNPSIELSTKITHDYKNVLEYFKVCHATEQFQINRFILTNDDLIEFNKRDYQHYPELLDFLVLPKNFEAAKFPIIVDSNNENAEQQAYEFIQKFTYELQASDYDYVVLSLPNEVNHLFGYEVIRNSDYLMNIITPSPSNIAKNREVRSYLQKGLENLNLYTIINMVSVHIEPSLYKSLLGVQKNVLLAHYDEERQESEFSLKIESSGLTQSLERLASDLGILLSVSHASKPKKSLFR